MTRPSFAELAHAVLDGEASPAERAELAARVATDAKAREEWDSLETAVRALRAARPLPPPGDLKRNIMRSIQSEGAVRLTAGLDRRPAARLDRRFAGWLDRKLAIRLAATFATGCAAGILVWSLATGRGGPSNLTVSGTLAPLGGAPAAVVVLDAATAHARVELRRIGDTVEARIDARSTDGATLVLDHDPQRTLTAIGGIVPAPAHAALEPGSITITFSGDLRYSLRIHGAGAGSPLLHFTLRSLGQDREQEVPIPGDHP